SVRLPRRAQRLSASSNESPEPLGSTSTRGLCAQRLSASSNESPSRQPWLTYAYRRAQRLSASSNESQEECRLPPEPGWVCSTPVGVIERIAVNLISSLAFSSCAQRLSASSNESQAGSERTR